MCWDVVEVKPEPDYRLFERVFIEQGAIAWPGEIDLAPDAMHADIARQRRDLSAEVLQGHEPREGLSR
jgi:hypothetical protein